MTDVIRRLVVSLAFWTCLDIAKRVCTTQGETWRFALLFIDQMYYNIVFILKFIRIKYSTYKNTELEYW